MACDSANGHALSVTESAKLENLELVIDGGLKSFIEVGRALMEIREGKLYRVTHMTFEDYCQERWGMSDSYAAKQIDAAATVNEIERTDNCRVSIPANEAQVRPLTKLPIEDRASAWKEAVASAPNGKPTAAIVGHPARTVAEVGRVREWQLRTEQRNESRSVSRPVLYQGDRRLAGHL